MEEPDDTHRDRSTRSRRRLLLRNWFGPIRLPSGNASKKARTRPNPLKAVRGTGWYRVRFILFWPYLIAVDRIAGARDEYDGLGDFLREWFVCPRRR